MVMWKMGVVFVIGCIIVLKLVEQIFLIVFYLVELIDQVGFFDGVINIVFGFGEIVGEVLINYDDVDKFVFIGFIEIGKKIMEKVVKNIKCVMLEFGGKLFNIILFDVNLKKVIFGVLNGVMFNQGQVCCVGFCVFIYKDKYDEVVSEMVLYVKLFW